MSYPFDDSDYLAATGEHLYQPHSHELIPDHPSYRPIPSETVKAFYKHAFARLYPMHRLPSKVVARLYDYYRHYGKLPYYDGRWDESRKSFPNFKDKKPKFQRWLKNVTRRENDSL